jgi:hypothetical protein
MDSGQLIGHGQYPAWVGRGPDDASEPPGEALHTLEDLSFPRSRRHLWDRSPLAPAKSVAGLVQDVALSVHQSVCASLRDLAMHVVPAVMASVSVQYVPEERRLGLQLCSPHHPMGVVDGMLTIRADHSDGTGNSVRRAPSPCSRSVLTSIASAAACTCCDDSTSARPSRIISMSSRSRQVR